eukprot:jgi/Psemu1/312320/fgenesh1_kg.921_\
MSASAEERLAKATELVAKDIAEHKIVVYAKTWCPHCNKTKETLKTDAFKDVSILIRDLDVMDDPTGPCLAKALHDKTGQTSVPNIFIAGKHLGGNSDFQEAVANGTLNLE